MAGFDPGDERATVEPLLPGKGRGPARKADQIAPKNGVFLRTGARRRDPPGHPR